MGVEMADNSIIKDPEYGYYRFEKLPTQEEVAQYYREEFYSTNYNACNDSAKEKQDIDREFNVGRYEDMSSSLTDILGHLEGKSLFDVGCGYGELLFFMKNKGLDVAGLEVAPEAVSFLQQQCLDVVQTDINDNMATLTNGKKYHIVTLLNVLEHLCNPADMLKNIREHLLMPGGCIVIDVPNEFNVLQTSADTIYNLGQWWISYPVHVNYFSVSSLTKLLQACGYNVQSQYGSFPMELFLLMGEQYVGNAEIGKQCHKKRVTFELNMRKAGKSQELKKFYTALAQCNFGRQIVCFATTPSHKD